MSDYFDPAYEHRLIAEYEGDEALLREVYAEYRQMQREKAEAERNLPRVIYWGNFFS